MTRLGARHFRMGKPHARRHTHQTEGLARTAWGVREDHPPPRSVGLETMPEYESLGPNAVRAPSGAVITLRGRAGVRYTTSDGAIDVDSEMLAPEMTIAVYPRSIVSPLIPRDQVLSEALGALRHLGFTVELIGTIP